MDLRLLNWYNNIMDMTKITPRQMDQMAHESNLSPFVCVRCNAHIDKRLELQIRREHNAFFGEKSARCSCGAGISVEESLLTVVPSSSPMINARTAKNTTWFHATNIYNWLEEVTMIDECRPYVHLGTKEAALELAKWKYLEDNDDDNPIFYLWEVTITDGAVLSDAILEDDNDWFYEVTDSTRNAIDGDVVRYLNKWESVGSISLLADPRHISSVRVHYVDIDNYFDFVEGNPNLLAAA